ncbi:MAG: zinc transporter ZupT [Candidatus Thermoplasmatota archaeon]|nr:zinc transporter ZupT [Candidatus Thermoplasmatota archaeon]
MIPAQTAFLLTTLAGLSAGIGGLTVFFIKKPKLSYLSPLLGFAAGVMIYISFAELLLEAIDGVGFLSANMAFFVGILFMFGLDKLVPHAHIDTEPDEFHKKLSKDEKTEARLKKAGVMTALGIALHNFPEGMAVFTVSLVDVSVGVSVAMAIAAHNIPEGIAVAVPIFYSSGSRAKGFGYSLLSGVAEPVGAAIGFLILYPFLTESVLSATLGFVGGIMVFISFDELLPISREYGDEHLSNLGLFLGMFIMMITLVLV